MKSDPELDDRIRRVMSDLRMETTVPGQEAPPCPLDQRMAQACTPAVSVAVVDDFEPAWARGFGERTAGAKAAADTPFQCGSISKPVFALAVMKLVEAGRLDLDTDVNDYLTSWRVPANDGWQPRVTLRQLLSHTAGTTIHGFPGYPVSGPWPTIPEVLQGTPPANTQAVVVDVLPRTQFRYSGGGTTIAQQVTADVTGRPFPELMRELVLGPVGMTDSSYEQPAPAAFAQRVAKGYPWNRTEIQGGYHIYPEMAAAGLWTTAADLARLGVDMMRALRGGPSALGLRQETIRGMLRPQLPDQTIGQSFVGLGWFCSGNDDTFAFSHDGGNNGYMATMLMLPAIGKGAAVIVNSIQGWMLRGEIIAAIGREYGWPALKDVPRVAAMDQAAVYAGAYEKDGERIRITQDASCLLVEFPHQQPIALHPAADREFFAKSLNLRLRFAGEDPASPSELTVTHGPKIDLFRRAD